MPPRTRRPIVTSIAVLLPIAVVAAACSDENRPGTYTGPSYSGNPGVLNDGGTSGEGGGSDVGVPGDGGGTCEPRAQACTTFTTPGGTPPGPINGGSLVQGTYMLVGSTGNYPCHTLYFADGFVYDVEVTAPASDAGPATNAVRASRFTVSGTGISLEESCPGVGTINASFGFDGTLLTIEQSGGARRDVYRKL